MQGITLFFVCLLIFILLFFFVSKETKKTADFNVENFTFTKNHDSKVLDSLFYPLAVD